MDPTQRRVSQRGELFKPTCWQVIDVIGPHFSSLGSCLWEGFAAVSA